MYYSIYKNLDEEEFLYFKGNLKRVECVVSPIMQQEGFYLNRDGHFKEYLGLDYLLEQSKYSGNIGVKYDEQNSFKGTRLFTFYILKTLNKGGTLFYKKDNLEGNYDIDDILRDSIFLFKKCLNAFHSISEEMLLPDERKSL